MADGACEVTAAAQRDAQIVMRGRVAIVVAERRLVVRDRIVERAVLEQHVSDVDDRAHRPRVQAQRPSQQRGSCPPVPGAQRFDRLPIEDRYRIVVEHR